jgi:hypothetical protein
MVGAGADPGVIGWGGETTAGIAPTGNILHHFSEKGYGKIKSVVEPAEVNRSLIVYAKEKGEVAPVL